MYKVDFTGIFDDIIKLVEEFEPYSFKVNSLEIGSMSVVGLVNTEDIRIVFTDGTYGLRAIDIAYIKISNTHLVTYYGMPLPKSDFKELKPNS